MKKIVAIVLTIAALLALALPVSAAAAAGKFVHQYYDVVSNTLVCLGTELPSGGTMSIAMGTQENIQGEYTNVEKAGLPTTVYCLVDTSAALGTKQLEQQKKILHSISGRMNSNDSMVIAQVGENFTESKLLTTTAERKQAIDSIQQSGKTKNLYKAVVDSIAALVTRNDFSLNRCLVILSDGVNDGSDSTTEQTAINAIVKSTIPVYSVAILPSWSGEWAQNRAQPIQRFADASMGGISFVPPANGITEEDAVAAIWKSMQNSTVILVDLNSIPRDPAQETLLMLARYDVQDTRYEDSVEIYAVDLPAVSAPPEPTVETTKGTEPPVDPPAEKEFPWWIVIAAAAAIVVVVILVVVLRKENPESITGNVESGDTGDGGVVFIDPIPETTGEDIKPVKSKTELLDGCDVTLTVIGHGELIYHFFLPVGQRKSAGRDGTRSDFTLNQSDMKLSGQHCILEWNGRKLSICDVSSHNSTCINGVRVQPKIWMNVENGATLRLGACDYRVKFERGVH